MPNEAGFFLAVPRRNPERFGAGLILTASPQQVLLSLHLFVGFPPETSGLSLKLHNRLFFLFHISSRLEAGLTTNKKF